MPQPAARILIVDDERSLAEFLEIFLRREGHVVEATTDPKEAITRIEQGEEYDLVLLDLMMPGVSGLVVLDAIKERFVDTAVLMMTAFATAETAVEAMKKGAYDYVQKPFNVDELRIVIGKGLEQRRLIAENRQLRAHVERAYSFHNMIGRSAAMQAVFDVIQRVAATRTTVLVTGESGTGKELIARAIHYNSTRRGEPLITVNCGAIPESLIESELFGHVKGAFTGAQSHKPGMFRAAAGGTIFLDEIAELPAHLQVKLLRVLQERRVRPVGAAEEVPCDVRVIAATNRDLEDLVREGGFREDLYYRLNVIRVEVPPLRDRSADIPVIAQHFLQRFSREMGKNLEDFEPEAMETLLAHDYPGNVRELENVVERAVTFESTDRITRASLPPRLLGPGGGRVAAGVPIPEGIPEDGLDLEWTVAEFERRILLQALERTSGHRTEAAKLLGISFRSLRYKLDKFDIEFEGDGRGA